MELRRAEEVQKCADKGWKSALICLGNMRKGGVSPGSAAYNVALKACTEAGEWDRAAALLADMEGTGGATPDADIVLKIEEALAGEGEGGAGTSRGEEGVLGDLSCDTAPTTSSSPGPSSASSGNVAGSSVRGKAGGLSSGGGGVSGGGTRGSIAGMHTMVALGTDASWPSRRTAGGDDGHNNNVNSNSNNNPSGRRMSNTSMNNTSGSRGSVTDMHTIIALGADSPWPSRRTSHAIDSNGNDGGMDGCSGDGAAGSRRSNSLSWGGWRWRNGQHRVHASQNQREEAKGGASHADAFYLGRGCRRAGIRAEKKAAPFAETWGDD
ncbi:unnamed protein product [Scytosiphon promiscuus]